MSKACCFTGHRELPSDPAVIKVLRENLRSAVRRAIDDGFTAFYAGGAVGCDMLAAEAVIAQRKRSRFRGTAAAFRKPIKCIKRRSKR